MTFGARVATMIAGIRFRGLVLLALMTTLILAVGAYTAVLAGSLPDARRQLAA